MKLENLAHNIKKEEDGIFYSKNDSSISYPEVGNEHCMQIEQDSFWFKHRNNVIAESVKSNSPEKVFFDIGGGNGFVSKRLQNDGINVVLVEPGKKGAINAHKRGIKNVLCSTLEDASFTNESMDSIGLFDVVEHIEDDSSFLNKINEYMKDEGHLYITVPAYKFLWSYADDFGGHFNRYTIAKLNALLNECGFRVIYSTYIFSLLPLPIFILKSLPSKLGFYKQSNRLEQHKNEHKKKGIFNALIEKIWQWELSRIRKNKTIPFGGSCFVIAKKVAA